MKYECQRCGEPRALTQFPRGLHHPCKRCLYGPKPRIRFILGGAPGMGKRNKRRR